MDRFSSAALTPHIEPLVMALGLDLEEIEVSRAGRRSVVRIIVDKDGGISLDEVASLTREVSKAIDADPAFGDQPFTLEVTSPGVDRPLTAPRHWRRNIGRLITITSASGEKILGRITSAADESVDLDVRGTVQTFLYTGIKRAQIEIEFNREERS
jgi:ribosome maturation factor RimP